MKTPTIILTGLLIFSFTISSSVKADNVENYTTEDSNLQSTPAENLEEEYALDEEYASENEYKLEEEAARRFVCVSRNLRGRRFRGVALRRRQAARRALRNCQSFSNRFLALTCTVRRCRMIRGGRPGRPGRF
jgi:hypothetical protein